jgi:hypothetical protein
MTVKDRVTTLITRAIGFDEREFEHRWRVFLAERLVELREEIGPAGVDALIPGMSMSDLDTNRHSHDEDRDARFDTR